jgi:hypothetical protein
LLTCLAWLGSEELFHIDPYVEELIVEAARNMIQKLYPNKRMKLHGLAYLVKFYTIRRPILA